jgi:glycine hydroxymethyltransferase
MYEFVEKQDAEVAAALAGEETREANGLELIPSENYASKAVREAQGSIFTNKYSEGYPSRRYYGGQEFTDQVETLAIERVKKIFNAKFANVQPHSGASANLAMYAALLEPGDTILGMDLSHGGHLTHGSPLTLENRIYKFAHYRMKDTETGEMDFDDMRRVAHEHKPKVILAGFSAYSRELDYEKFVAIARESGAYAVADIAHIAGLIAGGAHKNPFDFGFDVITSTTHKTLRGPRGGFILTRESEDLAKKIDKAVFPGTQGGPLMHVIAAKAVAFGEAMNPKFKDYAVQILKNAKAMEAVFTARNIRMLAGGTSNHLILADIFGSKGVSGGEAEKLLDTVGITLNKNIIADDARPPLDPSGIRFGTPAITSRGLKEAESARVAELMLDAVDSRADFGRLGAIREEVRQLSTKFPIPDSYL